MFPVNKKYISKFDIISFDIFDTLLFRRVQKPSDVWLILEKKEGKKGFFIDRKKADEKTYAKAIARGGETTLDEAYSLIPQWASLKEKELALEREVLYANKEMIEIWDFLGSIGKRRVITSDMYLPGDFIRRVLVENGIEGWDGFYLSNEHDCRKSSGQLFELLINNEGVLPEKILHVGDNELSDVKAPRKLGIKGRLYKQEGRWFPFTSYWTGVGYRLGGSLGYMYVSWIVRTAKKFGKNHLMFVGRDGYIWNKICNELWPEIKTDYFFAPRLVSIQTLGVIGSDPNALEDRRKYIEEHLKISNPQKVKKLYGDYLKQFTVDEETALVDGCSSGFSAQRLVEDTVGHPVFTFYLIAMAKLSYGAALFSTNLKFLPFQHFSEFVFGAPTPPAVGVNEKGIVFKEDCVNDEKFKMEVSEDICQGVMKKARELHTQKSVILQDRWVEYANHFMRNLTVEDKDELNKAKNAGDVQQLNFHPITWSPAAKERTILAIHRMTILTITYHIFKGRYFSVLMLFKRIPVMLKWKKHWNENVICSSPERTVD